MKITATKYGKDVAIATLCDPLHYQVRNVRVLNSCFSRLHPCIAELEKREKKIERKLLLRMFAMENLIQQSIKSDDLYLIERWEEHNKADFNIFFHDAIRKMIESIDDISMEYATIAFRTGYPYCM